MNKSCSIVYAILAVVGLSYACLFAAPAESNDQKVIFKISDSEINLFLNKTKTSNPRLYDSLMQLKSTSSGQFEMTVCGIIVQERLKNSGGLIEQSRRAQVDQTKAMYNISDQEISAYLAGLNRSDTADYNSLMSLKASDFSAYEMTLLGRVLNYRKAGSSSSSRGGAAGASMDELTKISTEIAQKSADVKGAKNPAVKQKAVSELKTLMSKSYDLSTELLKAQAVKAEEQVRAVNRMIGDRGRDKDKNIDIWVIQMTGE